MTDILMPQLTDQMEEGTIVAWLAEDGATVTAGQDIVEIESDKATTSCPARADGVLQVLAGVGDTLPVGAVIARVGAAPGHKDRETMATPPSPHPSGPAPEAPDDAARAIRSTRGPANASRELATPLARRAANMHGVVLSELTGSGPGGRVTKRDVLSAAGVVDHDAEPDEPRVATPPTERAAAPPAGITVRQPTRLQQIVAQRMTAATQTVPHFQVQTEVAIDGALELRQAMKAAATGGPTPSVNDLIVRACAIALPEHPLVNGSYRDGVFDLHDHVHIGIAVASDDGLVAATVRDADVKSLGTIARDTRSLAERVRSGQATPIDLTDATFTVSNLGMFGMTAITPVINPPQAAILGVGAVRETLARTADGEIVERKLLTLTLSCDHRILNGADGSRFLYDVKQILETPMRLAL